MKTWTDYGCGDFFFFFGGKVLEYKTPNAR